MILAASVISTMSTVAILVVCVVTIAVFTVHLWRTEPTAPKPVVKPPAPRKPAPREYSSNFSLLQAPRVMKDGSVNYLHPRTCTSCGKDRRHFKGGVCLKCSGNQQPVGAA